MLNRAVYNFNLYSVTASGDVSFCQSGDQGLAKIFVRERFSMQLAILYIQFLLFFYHTTLLQSAVHATAILSASLFLRPFVVLA